MGTISSVDAVVLVAYLVLMSAVGAYFMKFIHAEADFLKGGNRVEWWVAGMAAFMSGFSVWTFTGGAGFAYRNGVIGVFLLLLAVPAFAIGNLVFATRWRRARVSTVIEYVRERFGDGTHKIFSWMTVPSQLMFGSVRLLALASFLSVALGIGVSKLIVACGIVILLYTSLGGYWAVCFTDMFQFMFLFPIAVLLAALSLGATGGWTGLVEHAPSRFLNPFAGEYGWLFLLAYTVSQTIGYNNFANAQRYFCADTERSARKIAALCMALFAVGSLVFYLPPLAARIVLPELGVTANGLHEPSEAAYMMMGLRLLPHGLLGVLLAAMLASSMASLSATNHVVTGIIAKDLYQGYLNPRVSAAGMLRVSRAASVGVGLSTIGFALLLSSGARSVFTLLFVFESIFLVPIGLPILYGLLVPWGPWWCGLSAYGAGAASALAVSFALGDGGGGRMNETHMIAIPALATTIGFFVPALLDRSNGRVSERVRRLFAVLATPIDAAVELGEAPLSGRQQLALVGRVTMGLGALSLLLGFAATGVRDLGIVALYALVTTALGAAFVALGRVRPATRPAPARRPHGQERTASAANR